MGDRGWDRPLLFCTQNRGWLAGVWPMGASSSSDRKQLRFRRRAGGVEHLYYVADEGNVAGPCEASLALVGLPTDSRQP